MSKKLHKESRYEKENKALRKKAARRARTAVFALVCIAVLSLVLTYTLVLKPEKRYETALQAMEQDRWQEAYDGFHSLGSYKDAKDLAAVSGCMDLFTGGKLNDAAEAYLALNADSQETVRQRLGTFTALAESAMEQEQYSAAYIYYSLDVDNPERDDAMYAITVYTDSEMLISEKRYAEARSEISACLEESRALSAPLQTLLDRSYESEFDYYDSFTGTDLAFAVSGMESMIDEYEPAHIYLRDLRSAYYGGVLSMQEGKYADAIKQFEDISAYADTAQRLDECRMLLANQQAEEGKTQEALQTVKLVGDWEAYLSLLPEGNSLAPLLANKDAGEDADELTA